MDDKKVLRNVGDTALLVAVYRAIESEREDAWFCDPFARTLAGKRGQKIHENIDTDTSRVGGFTVRTRLVNEYVQKLIAQKKIDGVLCLGAGLCMRPYWLKLPSDFVWIEVDSADMLSYKKEAIQDATPHCTVVRIAADLSKKHERTRVFKQSEKYAQRFAVVCEGLLVYLEPREVQGLARELYAHKNVAAWMFDYAHETGFRRLSSLHGEQFIQANARYKFFIPNDTHVDELFGHMGWHATNVCYIEDEAEHLNRTTDSVVRSDKVWRNRFGFALMQK